MFQQTPPPLNEEIKIGCDLKKLDLLPETGIERDLRVFGFIGARHRCLNGLLILDITTEEERVLASYMTAGCRRADSASVYYDANDALDFLGQFLENPQFSRNIMSHEPDSCAPSIGVMKTHNLLAYYGNLCSAVAPNPVFRVQLCKPGAVSPFKARPSDSGFDLTLIDVVKVIGRVTLYGTGVKVRPDSGWYFDVVPRSSIIKSGYMLANSVGIIDRAYTGEIMVPLIKCDHNMPDLELPARMVQLIPRQIIHPTISVVDSIEDTARGEAGFGSSGHV